MRVAQVWSGAPLAGDLEELPRIIHRIDVVPGLGEQVGMPPLAARHVKNACADWQSKQFHQPRDFGARSFGCE